MDIKLKDGSILTLEENASCADAAKAISMGLYRNALCAKINGKVADLRTPLTEGDTLEICTFDSEEGKMTFWHRLSSIFIPLPSWPSAPPSKTVFITIFRWRPPSPPKIFWPLKRK